MQKKSVFTKRDFYRLKNPERYVTPMVGEFQFVTKRYIWWIDTKKSANLLLRNY